MEGAPDVHHPNRDQTARIYDNQTELNVKFNTGTFHHELVAGVETQSRDDRSVRLQCDEPVRSTNPEPAGISAAAVPSEPVRSRLHRHYPGKGKVYDATIDTIGVYAGDTIHLSKQWIFNAGIRLDDFSRDQVGGPGINAPGSAAAATAIATNTASVQANLLSWHTGLVYKPIPIASFYVAYATAQSPIGSELDSTGAQYNGISATLVNVPPQRAQSMRLAPNGNCSTSACLRRRRCLRQTSTMLAPTTP